MKEVPVLIAGGGPVGMTLACELARRDTACMLVERIHPIARCCDPLTGRNGCGVSNYRHNIPMPAHLGAQNAESVLGIVVGDALDEARQNFLG